MVVERTSMTPENYQRKLENYQRKFYRCLTVKNGEQCKFFMWQGDYAVWLLRTGYLRVSGQDEVETKAMFTEMMVAMRSMDEAMKLMNSEMKSSMGAIRVGLASNVAMVNRNSETLDRRLSVGSVFLGVLLLLVVILLAKK
ncbi:hypothetical protein ACP4OV_016363 [Aristida adscensionis]